MASEDRTVCAEANPYLDLLPLSMGSVEGLSGRIARFQTAPAWHASFFPLVSMGQRVRGCWACPLVDPLVGLSHCVLPPLLMANQLQLLREILCVRSVTHDVVNVVLLLNASK